MLAVEAGHGLLVGVEGYLVSEGDDALDKDPCLVTEVEDEGVGGVCGVGWHGLYFNLFLDGEWEEG